MAGIPLTVDRGPAAPPPIHQLLLNGILSENPVFRLALSLCPAVAVTTTVWNGIILGIAVLLVQVLSSCTVALLHGRIHPRVRIPAYTIIIAVWVSAIDMALAAFTPALYAQVGLYVKLIVAFAIIISRLEMFASRHPLVPSFFDGLGMGLGFLFALMAIAAFREFLGAGAILGFRVLPQKPLLFFALPAGGFFSIALFMALFNALERRRAARRKRPAAGGHAMALAFLAGAALLAAAGEARAAGPAIEGVRILAPDHVRVELAAPLADASPANFRWTAANAPDLPVAVREVKDEGGGRYLLALDGRVDPGGRYRLEIADPPLGRDVRPSAWSLLFGIVLSSALINNFVFTRYLGLCVFFGVSRKRETAVGMGFTFAAVMMLSAAMSWALFTWVLEPLTLGFLADPGLHRRGRVPRPDARHRAQEDPSRTAQEVRHLSRPHHDELHHPRRAAAQCRGAQRPGRVAGPGAGFGRRVRAGAVPHVVRPGEGRAGARARELQGAADRLPARRTVRARVHGLLGTGLHAMTGATP